MILWILLLLGAWLLGSIAFGALLVRWKTASDIRSQGSGNIGATNVYRIHGKALGAATLALDAAKGAIPVALALLIAPASPHLAPVVGLFALLGHCFPAYSFFKGGGKGVATAAGATLALSPITIGAALAVFLVVTIRWGRVSAGSLAAAATLKPFCNKSRTLASAFWWHSSACFRAT
jgi:glycerol-3-phosphate acyltransferase PlsY